MARGRLVALLVAVLLVIVGTTAAPVAMYWTWQWSMKERNCVAWCKAKPARFDGHCSCQRPDGTWHPAGW